MVLNSQQKKLFVKIFLGIVSILLFISLISIPNGVPCTKDKAPIDDQERMDHSYGVGLSYSLKHGWHMPSDISYILGPLGYAYCNTYDPDLFWLRYGWEIVTKLVIVYGIIRLALFLPSFSLQLFFLFAVMLLLPRAPDAFWLFSLTVLAAISIHEKQLTKKALLLFVMVFAAFSLIKQLFMAFSLIAILGLSILAWRRKGIRSALWPLFSYLMCLLLWWLVLGQNLLQLPSYVRHATDFTNGYIDAMAVQGPLSQVLVGATLLIVIELVIAYGAFKKPIETKKICLAAILAFGLFAEFKYGFTRQDFHTINFFTYSVLILFPIILLFNFKSREVKMAAAGIFICFITGAIALMCLRNQAPQIQTLAAHCAQRFTNNFSALVEPVKFSKNLDALLVTAQTNCGLPEIKSIVGNSPIDVWNHDVRVVILNGMNWYPRPVFQSHMVYTKLLKETNDRHYEGPNPPPYILFRLETIDNRLPSADEGQLLLKVISDYRPVHTEKDFVLLKRTIEKPISYKTLTTKRLRMGEWIEIPKTDGLLFTTVKTKYSLWGKIRRFFVKPLPLFISIRPQKGDNKVYRLIPKIAEEGFLIQPLLEIQEDFLNLYKKHWSNQMLSFSIDAEPNGRSSYKDQVDIEIKSVNLGL